VEEPDIKQVKTLLAEAVRREEIQET